MAPALGPHFCGSRSNQVISTGSSISIELRTDATGSNRGFRALWEGQYSLKTESSHGAKFVVMKYVT